MHESEAAIDDKFIVQQFIWPVSVEPDGASHHPAVRSEWQSLRDVAAQARRAAAVGEFVTAVT